MEKIVRLAWFSDPIEAGLVKNRLEEVGISAFISGDIAAGAFAGLGSAFAKIELYVPRSCLQRAFSVLEKIQTEEYHLDAEDSTAIEARDPPSRPVDEHVMAADTHIQAAPASDSAADQGSEPEIAAAMDQEAPEEVKDLDRPITWTAEALANRAWRAAVLGLVLFPGMFHLYSLFLLVNMMFKDEEVSPSGMRKVYGALALDLAVLPIVALIVLAILSHV